MDTVKQNCIICGSPPTHKLHDEVREGFFYVCEKQECKKLLEQQLKALQQDKFYILNKKTPTT